jgi:hypothetical protein
MPAKLQAAVEAEEDVYSYLPADNGAGPLWCFGGTTLARLGDQIFTTGLETLPEIKPLNNCRWTLWRRRDQGPGWEQVYTDTPALTREPAPVVCLGDNRLFVSANPALSPQPGYGVPAEPQVLEFSAAAAQFSPKLERPAWTGQPKFCEHSYRSFAADSRNGEILLLQNSGYEEAYLSFRDRAGAWSAGGRLTWPWGADYAVPQPIRLCYPNVALLNRAVHFFGVSDIVEPNPAFKEFKFKLTGREWDFDFRRLFYSWTPDVTRQPFRDWIEIASREQTCGWLTQCDLRAEADGLVHLLWVDKSCDPRLREKFFPDARLTISLEYAAVREGRIVRRATLACHHENTESPTPVFARFHAAGDGRLLAVAVFQAPQGGKERVENRVVEIGPDGAAGETAILDLKHPFTGMFFTATPRAGNRPSPILDLLGQGADRGNTIQYARIRM